VISYFLWPTPLVSHGAQRRWLHELVELTRMFHEPDFAGSFLFRGLYFVDLARV